MHNCVNDITLSHNCVTFQQLFILPYNIINKQNYMKRAMCKPYTSREVNLRRVPFDH